MLAAKTIRGSRVEWGTRTRIRCGFASLIEDVSTKIFGQLPDSVWFYPGHGKDSTLGEQRASVPEWRARGW